MEGLLCFRQGTDTKRATRVVLANIIDLLNLTEAHHDTTAAEEGERQQSLVMTLSITIHHL